MGRAAWRLLADPSALERETVAMRVHFAQVKSELLASRENSIAYNVAVDMVHQARLLTSRVCYDRLVRLADEADNSRRDRRRIQDEAEAYEMAVTHERESYYYEDESHAMAMAEEVEHCHAQAHAMQLSMRQRAPRRSRQRVMQEVLAEAYDSAPIQGFNPDAFEIVPTGGN